MDYFGLFRWHILSGHAVWQILVEMHAWTVYCGSEFSYDKCLSEHNHSIQGKGGEHAFSCCLDGNLKMKLSKRITYLVVVSDWDYSCMLHLDFIQERATKDQYKLSRIVVATWGD